MSRTGKLVDLILGLAFAELTSEVKVLVTHRWPDDDALLGIWVGKKFVPKMANAKVVLVNAGEILPGSEEDPSVWHFDTGGGENDQHGKELKDTCSTVLLVERLGLSDDLGLKPLLEMATAVDNIAILPPTSIHFTIEGYPRHRDFKNPDGTINWEKVQESTFQLFDIVYNQETARVQSRANLMKYAEWTTLANGIKVASLLWHPELREAAFEAGAAVVVWTQSRGKNRFYTGIQRNRQYPQLYLDNVAATLRQLEAQVRSISINVTGKNLLYIGREGPVNTWYLHDGLGLILNGSRSWKPTEDEHTKLVPRQIVGLIHKTLSFIPREVVSRWNKK